MHMYMQPIGLCSYDCHCLFLFPLDGPAHQHSHRRPDEEPECVC